MNTFLPDPPPIFFFFFGPPLRNAFYRIKSLLQRPCFFLADRLSKFTPRNFFPKPPRGRCPSVLLLGPSAGFPFVPLPVPPLARPLSPQSFSRDENPSSSKPKGVLVCQDLVIDSFGHRYFKGRPWTCPWILLPFCLPPTHVPDRHPLCFPSSCESHSLVSFTNRVPWAPTARPCLGPSE